jgi:hypothetical protein
MKKKKQNTKTVDEWGDEGKWVTIVDFTKIRRGGVPVSEVIKRLKNIK